MSLPELINRITLPSSLAQFIAPALHSQAEAALVAYVEKHVAYRVEQAKHDVLRAVAAYASHEMAPTTVKEAAPASIARRIQLERRGEWHDRFVEAFRAKYPKGERDLRNMIGRFPGGTTMTPTDHNALKEHFGMGARSQFLAPMLREIGCREDKNGRWITPASLLACAGSS